MRQILEAALSRTQSPVYVGLYRWERVKLRTLSLWARVLYEELVGLSSFKTGEVRTSYAQLMALLTPDQPAHGRRLAAPTLKQLRNAMDELQDAELIDRNKALNIEAGKLTLALESRQSAATRAANLGRDDSGGKEVKKWLSDNRLARAVHKKRAAKRAGGAEGHSSTTTPLPQTPADLSTGPQPPEPHDPHGPIRLSPGETPGAPRGADPRPADAGHAPEGVSTSEWHAALEESHEEAAARAQGEDGRARVLAIRQELAAKLGVPSKRRPRNTGLD